MDQKLSEMKIEGFFADIPQNFCDLGTIEGRLDLNNFLLWEILNELKVLNLFRQTGKKKEDYLVKGGRPNTYSKWKKELNKNGSKRISKRI